MSAMVDTPSAIGSDNKDKDRASSGINYATSPEVSNLQKKVTELLKERLTHRDEDNNEMDMSRKSPDSYMNRDYISSGNSCPVSTGNSVHDLTSMVSRHAMSMMRNESLTSKEGSKVLQGVLQNGENNNIENNSIESCDDTSSMVSKLLRERDIDVMRKNSYDEIDVDGDDSMPSDASPCDFSSEISDNDNNFTSNNSPSAAFLEEDDEFTEELNNSVNSESNDVKRARVENIISTMNNGSPLKENIVPPIDVRRHKRKQYIPQQHDSGRLMWNEPNSKMRKLEQDVLQSQLRQMQEQLATMQQRYAEMFEQQAANGNIDLAEVERRCLQRQQIINGMQEKENKINELTKQQSLYSMDIDSSPFIREARKLVSEKIDSIKPRFSPPSGDAPKDFENLAQILKMEITNSVGSLVDTVVARFMEHQKQSVTTAPAKSPEPVEKQKESTTEAPAAKEKQSVPLPATEPVKPQPEISHSIQKITNNNNEVKPITITPKSEHHFMPHIPQHSPEKHSPRFDHRLDHQKPHNRNKITDKLIPHFFDVPKPTFADLLRHGPLFPPPYFHPTQMPHPMPMFPHPQPKISEPEPEQSEPLSLVMNNTPKKKRTKVTDTRLSPRAARALLQEPVPAQQSHSEGMEPPTSQGFNDRLPPHPPHLGAQGPMHPPLLPVSLPTSVAIPNPSLQHSDILSNMFHNASHHHPHHDHSPFHEHFAPRINTSRSPSVRDHGSPGMTSMAGPGEYGMFGRDQDMFDGDCGTNVDGYPMTTTLTPMHLRKAKLMFFFTRYPSSSIIKIFFPDVKFNKNNTAQLVKWFSNFREFYYIQMEKYARQAIAEGVKNPEDLIVTTDSELYRVLNLHYNRNNQLEVPENFRIVVQATLREFYKSISAGKDQEQSWKKAIYKIIARMDDSIPDFFKSPNWMEQLNDN